MDRDRRRDGEGPGSPSSPPNRCLALCARQCVCPLFNAPSELGCGGVDYFAPCLYNEGLCN